MISREIPARWSGDPTLEVWAETPFRRLRHGRYWRYWWRTNAKLAAVSILFWFLFAWMYVEFATR